MTTVPEVRSERTTTRPLSASSRAADLRVCAPDALTTLHGTGAAYGDHAVRTFLAIRDLHGLDATSPASVRMCARMAQRIVLDELVDFCVAGNDGADRELLCDAAVWLDVLIAEPHAWTVSVAVGGDL